MQVRVYDVASMSCAYVLVRHTDIVVCIDTCISTYGRTMLVTGSKDNSVSDIPACLQCCSTVISIFSLLKHRMIRA